MNSPIQNDKPLTLNNNLSQGSRSTSHNSGGTPSTSQATAPTTPPASDQVDIERASLLYSSSTRQTEGSGEPAIRSATDANTVLVRLQESLANHPDQAIQAQAGVSTEQAKALLYS